MLESTSTKTIPASAKFLTTTSKLLAGTVWASALVFGLYILAFYFIGLLRGNPEQWNEMLPDLYDPKARPATLGIGIHFAAGGIILILGAVQLLDVVRKKYLNLHRWLGRIYVFACLLAGLGGLVFIFVKGTIGGIVMDIGFAGYGILMVWAAIETARHARAKRIEKHRAWGIRLFALAIGSWLYRMDYGFWFMLAKRLGHNSTFTGAFDYVMDFFFYLPNLLVAEFYIRRNKGIQFSWGQWLAGIGFCLAILFLWVASYFFIKKYWGPAILDVF